MSRYATDAIRNVALVGHGGAGKTSLTEALLYVSGATERQGRVEDGTTVTDFDAEEVKRRASIHAALAPCEWNGVRINLVDAPGYPDFLGEVAAALKVVEAALFVVSAQNSGGTDVGFDAAWDYAERYGLARAIFVNKMDKEHADYFGFVDTVRARYGKTIAPAEVPIGSGPSFHGVVDLVHLKAYTFEDGQRVDHPEGIPDDLQDTVARYREQLIESAAENDDALVEKYLNGEELTNAEIERGLHDGMAAGKVVPVVCGAATRDMGVRMLLDLIAAEFPTPTESHAADGHPKATAPFCAQVFKTIADPYVGKLTYFRVLSGILKSDSHVLNTRTGHDERIGPLFYLRGKQQIPTTEVGAGDIAAVAKLAETRTGDTLCDGAHPMTVEPIVFPEPVHTAAIVAKAKTDEDKLGPALRRLEEENPSFQTRRDPDTGETLICGLGESHLEMIVERLKRFGSDVQMHPPRVPYRETITGTAKAEGKHKKQSGGRGQFGDCWLSLEPLPRGDGFEFVDAIVGGAIPRQYIPAVEKGIREAMARGVLSGHPVVDVKATLYDGKYHDVDSSEMAFKIAGSLGFQNAVLSASPILLEPMLSLDITVPEEYMGAVIGDLNSRRGRVLGMEPCGAGKQRISAIAPQSEALRYATDLRSLTHGRGSFHAAPSHYEEMPDHIAQQVIADARKAGFSPHSEH
ncbi:MAG: elongation factor G [Armatimonadetes bacterium]|nr:elongation factor G [Armatimonadota bacterium]